MVEQETVVRARLEIKRSLSPVNLWHWLVVLDSGHVLAVSNDSFESAEPCIADASGAGLDALHRAEMEFFNQGEPYESQ